MKTKTFLTLLLLWTMIVGAMAEERSTLFVHLKDGYGAVCIARAETCGQFYPWHDEGRLSRKWK